MRTPRTAICVYKLISLFVSVSLALTLIHCSVFTYAPFVLQKIGMSVKDTQALLVRTHVQLGVQNPDEYVLTQYVLGGGGSVLCGSSPVSV